MFLLKQDSVRRAVLILSRYQESFLKLRSTPHEVARIRLVGELSLSVIYIEATPDSGLVHMLKVYP
jgi:hypothetical protein